MTITLKNLDSIVSEIPNLIGFTPAESIVLLALRHREGAMSSPVLATRSDLPQPEYYRDVAEYFTVVVGPNTADMIIAVVISDNQMQEYREFIDQLVAVYGRHGMDVHAVWTTLRPAEEWVSYHDGACRDRVYDTSSSPLAAATAVSGLPRYGSRGEMEASLAPVPDPERADWARRLDQRPRTEPSTSLWDAATTVFAALTQLRAGQSVDTDTAVAALEAIVSDGRVRDLMYTTQEPAAVQLWTMLVRHAPEEYVAEPATLLALAEYLHGNGPMANIALDRAVAATPEHPGAQLVRPFLQMPPDALRAALDEVAEELANQLD